MRILILLLALLTSLPACAQSVIPPPNSTVSNGQPAISATFLTPMRTVRVTVDGQDVTGQARVVANQVSVNLATPLQPGPHQVFIEGMNVLGLSERAIWNFTVVGAAPLSPKPPSAYTPFPGTTVEGQRPMLSAEFPESLVTARMLLDRTDYSNQVQLVGNRANWMPQSDLQVGQHIAEVQATGLSGQPYQGSWLFIVRAAPTPAPLPPPPPPPGGASTTQSLSNLNPPPNAQLMMARPWISADYPQPVNNARMLVDGVDVSGQAQRTATRISWNPAYDLQNGQHTVVVDGVTPSGQVLAGSWTFQVQGLVNTPTPLPTPTPMPAQTAVSIQTPQSGQRVNRIFEVRGRAQPGALVRLTVREVSSGLSKQYQATVSRSGSFGMRLDTGWAAMRARLEVTVTAQDRSTGQVYGQPVVFSVRRNN